MLHYRILLDTQRNGLFTGYANDITSYVKRISLQFGANAAYEYMATNAYMELVLDNSGGDFNLQNPNAKYYGKVRRGTLVRVQASLNASTWVTLGTLKIQNKTPSYTMNGDHELILSATDTIQSFLSQEFIPPLLTNVRVDEILDAAFETTILVWPYESYYQFIGHTSIGDGRAPFVGSEFTEFETAETTLSFYGDNLDKGDGVSLQDYIKKAVQAEIFGLFYFSPRDELIHFLSRYHASDTGVVWDIDTTITDAPMYTDGRDLVNDYTLSFSPREIGTANSLLWESQSVPIQIAAQESKLIIAKYRNPDFPTAAVGALAVDIPVKGVDLIANSESDGSGEDWTRFLFPSVKYGAASSEIRIYNRKVGDPAYITTLQLKGTPITAYDKETVRGYNDDSVFGLGDDETTGNDRAVGSDTMDAIDDVDFAQSVADFKVNTFGTPITVIERLSIPVKPNDTVTQAKVLTTTIGDVINFQDSANSHDLDYMIVGERHTINPQTTPPSHMVTYTLRPTERGSVFIIGESFSDANDTLSF
jgi:hypothetical protein